MVETTVTIPKQLITSPLAAQLQGQLYLMLFLSSRDRPTRLACLSIDLLYTLQTLRFCQDSVYILNLYTFVNYFSSLETNELLYKKNISVGHWPSICPCINMPCIPTLTYGPETIQMCLKYVWHIHLEGICHIDLYILILFWKKMIWRRKCP
jgi:hypothetical protein